MRGTPKSIPVEHAKPLRLLEINSREDIDEAWAEAYEATKHG